MQCARTLHFLWPAPLYKIIPQFLIIDTILEKKKLLKAIFFLISQQLLSKTVLILRRNKRDMIKMYIGFHVKCPLFLLYFN